jgi:hypothetical protein
MRFAYSIKQKFQIAVLLFFVMACSILIRILEDKSMSNMNASFVSLYNDRLIPTMDLYHIVDNVYSRKNLIESVVYSKTPAEQVNLKGQLGTYNKNIDSLLHKYEKTYLVEQEKVQLKLLKQNLQRMINIEQQLLQEIYKQESITALKLYESQVKPLFLKTTSHLTAMIDTQKQVGNEIIKHTENIVSGTKIYSNLQLALAILIGILIVAILFTSNVVNIRNDNFRMN